MMMKNKKIILVVIIILAVILGTLKICSSYLFNNSDNGITNGKVELINHLQSIEDKDERKNQIDYSVEQNIITQKEANELY
jgi:uncharacterized protein YxeA